MSFVLVAGASGEVGKAVVAQLKTQGHRVRALVRNQNKSAKNSALIDEIFVADARRAEALKNICEGVDIVISTIGASLKLGPTRDGGNYWEVDFQANENLLKEAQKSRVKKFIYLSVFHADRVPGKAYFESHFAFEKELRNSSLDYAIIRPTGIFYIFEEFVQLARRGLIPLFGDGSARTNPIDEKEVAKVCVAAIDGEQKIIEVGGPEVLTRREISELCFRVLGKTPRFIKYPVGLLQILIKPLRWFDQRLFDLLDFAIYVNTNDCIAPAAGTNKLESHLKQLTAGRSG